MGEQDLQERVERENKRKKEQKTNAYNSDLQNDNRKMIIFFKFLDDWTRKTADAAGKNMNMISETRRTFFFLTQET